MISPRRARHRGTSQLICQISVSLDGFVAGPNQSLENPLGEGGERLHEWALTTAAWRRQHGLAGGSDGADSRVVEEVQQYLASGVLDELYLHIVPVLLGGGERLLQNVGDPALEPVEVVASPAVTHVKYRVVR
jgi:hypothetical protein